MNRLLAIIGSVLLGGAAGATWAGEAPAAGKQRSGTFEKEITVTVRMNYLLFLPEKYEERDAWPMIVFLHGAGERGDDLELVKTHGPPKIVEKKKDFPFIVVSPQCERGRWWSAEAVAALVEKVASECKADRERIYLTGLSMGGLGTWETAARYPDLFAALVPICGHADPKSAESIKHVPIWVFHGAKDNAVPLKSSEGMVNALKALGSDVKFTVYPEAGHDSWSETYDNPRLYDWLLEQRRGRKSGG